MITGNIIGAIINALSLNIFLKMIIAFIVTFISISQMVYPKPENKKILKSSLIIALAGSFIFQVMLWFPGGLIGLILGIVIYWVLTSAFLDRFFDINFEQSYNYTGSIVVISILLWGILGAIISLVF